MKNTIIVLMMAFMSLSSFAFDIPSKPNPPKLVNDYIGLLQATQVQALENKLVDFNNKTSIQIAIVILDDLDGEEAEIVAPEIGQQWGVGQKGLDNGIVFLIVKYSQSAIEKLFTQKHGDYYIATGYGIDSYLTDADAKQIAESNFIPYAKEDNYFEGINQTIDVIISDLGEIGWQQREELEAKRKAERDEAMRKFGNGLLMFLIFGSIVGLIIFLIVRARKAYLKAEKITKQRKELKESFIAEAETYTNFFKQIPDDSSKYPAWAKIRHDNIMKSIDDRIKPNADQERENFLRIFGNDLEPMRQSLARFTTLTSELEVLIRELQAIPTEVAKYHDEAPVKLNTAKKLWDRFNDSVNSAKGKGFKLPIYQEYLKNFETNLNDLDVIWTKDPVKAKDVFRISNDITEQIESAMLLMENFIADKDTTSKIIANLNSEINSLPAKKESAQKVLDQLKSENPKQNWEDLDTAFGSVSALLSLCKSKKEEAELRNGMDIQDFTTAKTFADEANEKMQKIMNVFHNIHDRKSEIISAEASFTTVLEATEKEMNKAKSKTAEDDVEQGAKDKLAESGKKMGEAQSALGKELVNWLMVIALLTAAKELADEAYTMAEDDITKAEDARTAATAAIAAAAAAALAKKKADNEPSKTYYNSSPSPSNTGGGFGGFGGGSFGGGGAGGSW